MAANLPFLLFPAQSHHTKLHGMSRCPVVRCSYSNGRKPDSKEEGAKSAEEQRRAELSARIASGEFTFWFPLVYPEPLFIHLNCLWLFAIFLGTRFQSLLSKLGVPSEVLEFLSKWTDAGEGYPKIPEAKGAISAIRSEAFFIPLYELYLTYGGIFRLTFGPKSFVIVSDPSIAKHILRDNSKSYSKGILAEILEFVMGTGLIPADGEVWRIRRRTIVPALHQKYVAAMISLFGEATNRLCRKLDAAAYDGEDVEMESLFSRLTLDIIGKALFNYDFDSLTYDTGIVEAVYTVLREAEDRSVAPIPVWEIPIWKDISPRQKKVNAALKLINGTLDDLIAVCKPATKKQLVRGAFMYSLTASDLIEMAPHKFVALKFLSDSLYLLMVSQRMVDEEELQFHEEYMNESDPSILHFLLASGDDVTSKQLRDDLMTMLIAGHETTAAVLTWTFYLLSKEPSVMAKLQNEVDSVLGDRFPTIEHMKKLKYTTRVINESLRLYPQPPVLIRRSTGDDILGKYPIKRGEDIFISVWNLHRSPKHWEDSDKFNPERWPLDGPNPNETNQNFSYLPFGGGPRKCVGDMFASFEAVVAVAMLVRRFNFQIALGAPPVRMTTGATIHTTEGLKMTVTRRPQPPVVPNLEMPVLKVDSSVSISEVEQVAQKCEVSPAHS
ncbi:hypothetical protein RJ639_040146 [Escallonia herrerae]|uniref:Cytochrome P450 n=1 Tax=Escallonia herrerae TaxID=1293975 RepID=A0AA89B288_9ASTE|nr:hypothetical protein RJ639_040146 [Escallonia herrerae]